MCRKTKKRFGLGAIALVAFMILGCAAQPQAPSAASTAVTGSLVFASDAALPNGAQAEINLLDVTVKSGEPQVIASQKIDVSGKQTPVAFAVNYDTGKINTGHTYGIAAKIMQGQQLLFTTAEPTDVLTQGKPSINVQIKMEGAGPEAPSSSDSLDLAQGLTQQVGR